jgi:NinB protein
VKVTLYNAQQAHTVLKDVWTKAKPYLMAGNKLVLTIEQEKRSLDQNALLWSVLTDLSKSVHWHGEKLTKEEYKDLLTAGLKRQRAIPGIDGGFVVLGSSTSKMTKQEMSDLITLAHSFGDERGVKWSPTSIGDANDVPKA